MMPFYNCLFTTAPSTAVCSCKPKFRASANTERERAKHQLVLLKHATSTEMCKFLKKEIIVQIPYSASHSHRQSFVEHVLRFPPRISRASRFLQIILQSSVSSQMESNILWMVQASLYGPDGRNILFVSRNLVRNDSRAPVTSGADCIRAVSAESGFRYERLKSGSKFLEPRVTKKDVFKNPS